MGVAELLGQGCDLRLKGGDILAISQGPFFEEVADAGKRLGEGRRVCL